MDDARRSWYKKRKCLFTKKLRREMTSAEMILWRELRNRRFRNIKFRRQVNIGPYIADFLCKQHRLIVEVDGSVHTEQKEYDHERDLYLKECGYSVLRITNQDVMENIEFALQQIYNAIFS